MAENTGRTGNAKDRLQEAATSATHRAQEAGQAVAHRAQEAGQTLAHRAQEGAGAVERRADDALTNVGEGMTSLAGQVRQRAPQSGMLGSATSAVAGGLEESGRYFREHGVRDMADDATNVIRRYPVAALCIGFSAGFLLGMALTRR
jgi:ElaB/YqjD/DUF883 family membrane-anchored ribosome-binding protein